jgi:hypothetical protein
MTGSTTVEGEGADWAMVVNDLLSIIDRLIQLTEYRHRRFRLLFESLLEPAFAELLLVHGDYIRMFGETRRLLPNRSRGGLVAGQIADLIDRSIGNGPSFAQERGQVRSDNE